MNPTIQTERLILRPYQLSDAQQLRVLADNLKVARMLSRLPHPYLEGEAERWIGTHDDLRARGAGYPLAITKDGELLGSVGIERCEEGVFELGYWLAEPIWGQGVGTEAARGALAFAFDELALPFVRARHIADNRASARILTKVGFLATARSRTYHAVRQEEVEMIHLIVLRTAFARDDDLAKKVYKAA